MFGLFSKKATEYSNHYIDWSRIGELFQSRNHRYSNGEILLRGCMIALTAVSAYLGAYMNNEEKTHCSTTMVSIAAGALGFSVIHAAVILPLIKKRYEMNKECEKLVNEIEFKIAKSDVLTLKYDAIHSVIQSVLELSLTDQAHGRASQTWGRRKNLLSKISAALDDHQMNAEFWKDDANAIIHKLSR